MKTTTVVASLTLAACLGLAAGLAAQPEKKAPPAAPAQPDEAKMMEEMAKAAQPGPEHKMLAGMAGTWDCACKFYMPGPDGKIEEMASKGEAKFTLELEGRWVRQDFKGTFMEGPFSGIGFSGYDNVQKKYVGTWMDTWMTGMVALSGSYDASSKTLTQTGTCVMPGMGEVKSRYVTQEKDANTYVFTMYNTRAGMPETKDGEIVYTRRK